MAILWFRTGNIASKELLLNKPEVFYLPDSVKAEYVTEKAFTVDLRGLEGVFYDWSLPPYIG